MGSLARPGFDGLISRLKREAPIGARILALHPYVNEEVGGSVVDYFVHYRNAEARSSEIHFGVIALLDDEHLTNDGTKSVQECSAYEVV